MKLMVWYWEVALPLAPSFSLKAENGVLAVPLLGWFWVVAAPKPPPVAPKPPVVVLVLLAPNPPPVFPLPNSPPPPVDAPKAGLAAAPPKRLPVLLLDAPNAGVLVELLLFAPKPPKPVPEDAPPKRPPPVVELPNGVEPKALLAVFAPKPPRKRC